MDTILLKTYPQQISTIFVISQSFRILYIIHFLVIENFVQFYYHGLPDFSNSDCQNIISLGLKCLY